MAGLKSKLAAILTVVLIVSGCLKIAGRLPAKLRLKVISAESHCPSLSKTSSALWFENPEQAGHVLGGMKIPADLSPNNGLLFISMGLQPSGGFSISLARPTAELKNDTAFVDVLWQRPPPGSLVTQALTSPCLLLEMEKARFHTIVIRDQDGNIRAAIKN